MRASFSFLRESGFREPTLVRAGIATAVQRLHDIELNSMEFDRTLPLRGDPDRVLQLALRILSNSGFKLTRKGAGFLDFASDLANGNPHPLLSVASRLYIEAYGGHVRLCARLGGLRSMQNLLLVLPSALGVFFVALFMLLFRQLGMHFVLFVALAPVVPWLVLTPLLMGWIRRRTERALDALLTDLVRVADGDAGERRPPQEGHPAAPGDGGS